jgi:hypothetical protein
MSERGEQQSCLIEENNNHVWERRTTIMVLSQTWFVFSSLRNNCCSPLSEMIIVLLSQTWFLFCSLWHDWCSPLLDMIVGELQTCLREENNNYVWERRTTIMSERGEQQSCLGQWTTIMSERGEQHRHTCCSPLSYMIIVLLSQT